MDDLKILIVGAGVAGLTCANLLTSRGLRPLIIEREAKGKFNTSGYMLGLLPLGGRVFNELHLRDDYFRESIPLINTKRTIRAITGLSKNILTG